MGAQKKKKIKCISHEVISRESSALNNKNYTDDLSTVWERRRRRYKIFRPEVTTRDSSALNWLPYVAPFELILHGTAFQNCGLYLKSRTTAICSTRSLEEMHTQLYMFAQF